MNDRTLPSSPRWTTDTIPPEKSLLPGFAAPINILIVDDEPKNLTVLETILDDPGYRLVRAQNADQALLALVADEFALLILDIRMPTLTGFELATLIKGRKKTAVVPIIFLTAYYNEDQHVLEGYGSGAVDYLHKPVSPAILRAKVAIFADLFRKNREIAEASRALHAEVLQRRAAEERLRELNDTLDQQVTQRTAALAEASAALNATGERYRSLFAGSLDAIFSLDADGRFVAANPAAVTLTGRTLEELKVIHFLELCAPEQRAAADRAFRAAFSLQCLTIDTTLITATGERRELFISGAPAIVDDQVAGVSCIARDVTERRSAERALRATQLKLAAHADGLEKNVADRTADLRASVEELEAFSYSIAHDMRAPLRSMQAFSSILISDHSEQLNAEGRGHLTRIASSANRMDLLIRDVLDYSKVARAEMVKQPVDVEALIHEIVAAYPTLEAAAADITVEGPLSRVQANPAALTQVVSNLLGNAVKFVAPGVRPRVRVSAVETAGIVRLCFADNGIGIAPQSQAQLFNIFVRLNRPGDYEGTGIGLAIVRKAVERMGGTVGLESEVGKGSCFWVELKKGN